MGPVRTLGWIVRFMPFEHMGPVGDFYENRVGLSRLYSVRHAIDWGRQDKDFYWGGECILLETFFNGRVPPSAADGDPARAPLVPMFRTHDLDALLAEWTSHGLAPIGVTEVPNGREAFVRDPAGLLLGARQVTDPIGLHDREAQRRRARGEAFNPGCAPMPALLQEIGWVRRRVADVVGLRAFYRDLLGLPLIASGEGWDHYDTGDNLILELASGGVARAAPAAQIETSGVPILRVNDTIALRDAARAAGYAIVHELYDVARGKLSYVCDGEGNLIGFMQMNHPSLYFKSFKPSADDLEAERRWAETRAAIPAG